MSEKKENDIFLVELSNYVKPDVVEHRSKNWVLNGEGNCFFDYVIDRYNGSPTNGAIISGFVNLIYGQGLTAKDASKKPEQFAKLRTILKDDDVRNIVLDYKLQGQFSFQVTRNKIGEIISITHFPVETLAPEKMNEEGVIENYYYSKDWKHYKRSGNEPIEIPVYEQGGKGNSMYVAKPYTPAKMYFANPDYIQGLQYAEMEEEISNFSINHIKKGLSFGYIINFNNGDNLNDDQKREIKRMIKQKLTGSTNAGDFILSFNNGKEAEVTIVPLDVTDAHEKWESLSTQAEQKIIRSHKVVSPKLFGIIDASGFSNNAEEMEVAMKFTMDMVINPAQDFIVASLSEVLNEAGINLDLYFKPLSEEEQKEEEREDVIDDVSSETTLSKQIELESFTDYPQGATNNAKRALEWAEKNGWGSCGTNVGKQRANQLAKREPISLETVKRMAAFRRHQQNKDVPYSEGCGGLMWDAWGGDSGIRWAETKISELSESVSLCCNKIELTEEQENTLNNYLDEFISLGEDVNDEWELHSAEPVDYENDDKLNEELFKLAKAVSSSPANKSEQDKGLFKVRYRYSPNSASPNSREFCKKMVAANKVYRKEDITAVDNRVVNEGWGANGANTYSVWFYKGGGSCRHFWQREVYFRKRENGKFLPNKGLTNDEKVSVNKARREGFTPEKNPKEVAQRPRDMKNRGFLEPKNFTTALKKYFGWLYS
jgi:hypothetical protein